ncbi:class I SAM-dependent methyltransferase [Parafrankia sp. EUN1f]|uniref:class I SAM-dependent methyltransferase n=1 Tax=Parafrankia sp. EUN1f TaxID=102897 RepID=UPI0001C467A8|nr:class I SAM-dependent methyltransferase [Parafrankia sp. EUN1f]EFC81144.1 Methyltransferase type 12 [Parafrankia sp. EUN1f]
MASATSGSAAGSGDLSDDVVAGQAAYNRWVLAAYDIGVLGISNSFVWRCPTKRLRRLYDDHVSARHLDIGVGTGYYLDKARWPTPNPAVTLVDLNQNSLRTASARISRLAPLTAVRNALEPVGTLPGAPFDSVGVNYLLHCMPGSLDVKAEKLLAAIRPTMGPRAVLFGSTILADAANLSAPARKLLGFYNQKGIFHNTADQVGALDRALEAVFATHRVEIIGGVATFVASEPRPLDVP